MPMMVVSIFPKEFCLCNNNPEVCMVFFNTGSQRMGLESVFILHLEMGKVRQLLGEVCLMFGEKEALDFQPRTG